ncbi:MAG: hypothetical protein QX191_08855 [Methylococcaceae bacterium]
MKSYFLKIAALFIVPISISLAAGSCNNATLNGSYALLAHGTIMGMNPFNAVGVIIFDGQGHLRGSGSLIDTGSWLEYQSHGTYFVSRDCSVRIDETPTSSISKTQFGMLTNDGKKIFAIATEEGKNFSFIYEKQ